MKKRSLKKLLSVVLSTAMMITSMAVPAAAGEEEDVFFEEPEEETAEEVAVAGVEAEAEAGAEVEPEGDPAHTIWVVGDSTVCNYIKADGVTHEDGNTYYQRYGWGTQLDKFVDSTYAIQNLAISGKSSKDYHVEDKQGYYAKLFDATNGIKADDVLIIGFGHNDQKLEDARYTNPNGDYNTEGSFAHELYTYYVKPAQDKGASVVLCTPIIRTNASGTLTDANRHITSTSGKYEGGNYAAAIKTLGSTLNIPVVDLTTITENKYKEVGYDVYKYMHAVNKGKWKEGHSFDEFTQPYNAQTEYEKDPTGYEAKIEADFASIDTTHINNYGAKWVAYHVMKAVSETTAANFADLRSHIVSLTEPTVADLVSNSKYLMINYEAPAPDAGSLKWKNYISPQGVVFRPAVFGTGTGLTYDSETNTLGGSVANHTLEQVGDNAHIQITGNKGKIANKEDGMDVYFVQLPAKQEFVFSADVTVTEFDNSDKQGAFGLIARDSIWIDGINVMSDHNYVAAGTMSGDARCNCFFRKGGTLGGKAALTGVTAADGFKGNTYSLSIERSTEGYTCKFGDETPQSAGYDVDLTTVDAEYQYVGMFASRLADVTFSNVSLKVKCDDGEYRVPGEAYLTDHKMMVNTEWTPEFAYAPGSVSPNEVTGAVWSTTDTSGVISIEAATGKVTSLKKGSATIKATVGDKVYTATVTVQDPVTIKNKEGASVFVNETLKISVDKLVDGTLEWESLSPQLATVDASGVVTGLAEGQATIKAKVGDYSDTITIEVKKKKAQSIKIDIDLEELELELNDEIALTATVSPNDAGDEVIWSSDAEDVATVEDGLVKAIAAGDATITATAGEVSDQIVVHVKAPDNGGDGGDGEPTAKELAEEARTAGKGDVKDTVGIQTESAKPGYVLKIDTSSANAASGNGVIKHTITIAKGSKIRLDGYSKVDSKQFKTANNASKKNAAINGKGILAGKKDSAAPVVVKYALDSKTSVELSVNVKNPTVSIGDGKSVSGNSTSVNAVAQAPKKLNVTFTGKGGFDIKLDTFPLTTTILDAKVKKKKGIVIDGMQVGSDGALHITGAIDAKQSAIIPLVVYGKKYTLKIKSKIK